MDRIPSMRSVMTPFPYSIDEESPLRQARTMMVENSIRHLPVKRGDRLVGLLSDRDLKRALDPDLGLPGKDELFVRDVAVFDAFVADVGDPLDDVLLRMADERLGSVLVAKQGKLAGIFTMTDACRLLGEHLRAQYGKAGDRAPA